MAQEELGSEVQQKMEEEEEEQQQQQQLQRRHTNSDLSLACKSFKRTSSCTITLNVGGHLYAALRQTLARHPGSLLEEIANNRRPVLLDPAGNAFIDRDGLVFGHVLNFLRLGELLLPRDFGEVGLLRREAEFYHLGELVRAIQEWEKRQATRHKPGFLELTDDTRQGLRLYCSDPAVVDSAKERLLHVSKTRLDGFPSEFEVSANVLQFRHFAKSEASSRLVLLKDSTFVCTVECLKMEVVMLALKGGYRLATALDSSRGSLMQYDALHFVK